MLKKNFLLGATLGVIIGISSFSAAQAADQDVDASIVTKAAISFTKNADMDFGQVEYAAVHSGSIRLGTNGAVDLVGAAGLTMSGAPAAGDVDITSDGASVVDVSCTTGATLTDGGANTLTLSAAEIAFNTGAAGGAGTACAGLGVAVLTPTMDGTDKLLLGGLLDTTADAIDTSTTYSTTNAGGAAATIRVTYQ